MFIHVTDITDEQSLSKIRFFSSEYLNSIILILILKQLSKKENEEEKTFHNIRIKIYIKIKAIEFTLVTLFKFDKILILGK